MCNQTTKGVTKEKKDFNFKWTVKPTINPLKKNIKNSQSQCNKSELKNWIII